MGTRKRYSKEFKEGTVRLVVEQGRTVGDVATSLGIARWSLTRWLAAAKAEGTEAFRGNGVRTAAEEEVFSFRVFPVEKES